VHLSVDQETAFLVAKRKHGISFIITVEASKAYQNGIKFYQGNKTTWLADYVSVDYLNFSTSVSCELMTAGANSIFRACLKIDDLIWLQGPIFAHLSLFRMKSIRS
jgi:hypothetical protein